MPSGCKSLTTLRMSSANRAQVQESPDTTILTAMSLACRRFSSYVICLFWACAGVIKASTVNSTYINANNFLLANVDMRIDVSPTGITRLVPPNATFQTHTRQVPRSSRARFSIRVARTHLNECDHRNVTTTVVHCQPRRDGNRSAWSSLMLSQHESA